MGKDSLNIAGQRPSIKWKRNAGRKKRSIEQALIMVRDLGFEVPDDVYFVEAEPGELPGTLRGFLAGGQMVTARGPRVAEHADGYVYWKDHYNDLTGKIPFQVHPDILTGDECIVGVFVHELTELKMLREVFLESRRRRMSAIDYESQVSPGRKGNFHDLAWDAADEAVKKLRGTRNE